MSAATRRRPGPGAGRPAPYAYLDRWTVRPGERLSLHVSSDAPFETAVVRLVQADDGVDAPGRKEVPQDWYGPSVHEARVQPVRPGSRAVSGPLRMLEGASSVELEVMFRPSVIGGDGAHVIGAEGAHAVASLLAGGGGCALAIALGADGLPELHLGTGGTLRRMSSALAGGKPLRARRWFRARAVLDLERAAFELSVQSAEPAPGGAQSFELRGELARGELAHLRGVGAPRVLVLAAARGDASLPAPDDGLGHFNGKLEAPIVSGWRQTTRGGRRRFRYAWRLGQGVHGPELLDTGREHASLRLVNAPTAGVTGHTWDGTVLDFSKAPEQYDALAFHDDDLEDAAWEPTCQVEIPVSLASGVYALVVSSDAGARYVPFFVVPAPRRPRAKIAVLLPTFTYLAYANEHVREEVREFQHVPTTPSRQDLEIEAHRDFGLSLYDRHRDGSGVCYSSLRRPVLNFDPTYRFWLFAGPVHLGEDLYLVDWLEHLGYEHDVITDHELHAEGAPRSRATAWLSPEATPNMRASRCSPRSRATCASAEGSCTSAATGTTGSPRSTPAGRT